MAQNVRTLAPEAGDGFADGVVVTGGVGVDVAGVVEFGGRGGVDEVDFGVGERFEGLCIFMNQSVFFVALVNLIDRSIVGGRGTDRHLKFLRQRIYFRMLQKLRAAFVEFWLRWVDLEDPAREFMGEIFACIEVLEKA